VKNSILFAALVAIGLATCACSGGSTPTSGGSPKPQATVTVTAAPTPTLTAPAFATITENPPTPTASATPTAAAGCLTRYLNGSVGLSQGTAGSVMLAIVFKNLDNVPCTLYGFPGVAQAAGTPVTDIGLPSTEMSSTARVLVTLQPGGYANATLVIADASNFPASTCNPVPADWLAVIPPNQTVPLYIHYSSTACKGNEHVLTVSTVQPGNGG
jgi:hypothetical protein